MSSSEDSLILATPETADAVHAWKIIYKIAEAIGTSDTVDDLLERVADIISDRMELDRIFLLMKDTESGEYQTRVVRRRGRKRDAAQPKITASRTIIKHVLDHREGVLCANAMSDHRFGEFAKEGSIARLGLRSVICVPIVAHEEVHGVIHMDCSMSHHTYTNEQLRLATAIGRMTGMAIENLRLLESRMANERLAAVGETVAHLSHYIRNVLQGISSGAEIVDIGLKKDSLEHIRTGWGIVQRNLDRTYQLTTNMLTFSKERKAAVELGSLNRAVEDALAILQRRADEKGVMLLADLDETLPSVPMDFDGMVQVALNVVGNAIDATAKDQGQVTIQSSYDVKGDAVSLIIHDNGPGIPEDEMENIFDAFHSTKGHSGTGLGLAAARKIIRELGGRISVRSKPGDGTTFIVQLAVGTVELADSEKTHGHAV
jgi:K+-sensing histidine kinase KdpD